MYKKTILSISVGLALQGGLATTAQAQQSMVLEEVIVTARFREESTQDIGASIKAVSGTDMNDKGIDQISDLARITPSLSLQDRGPNRNEISIRGVGRSLFQQDRTVNNPNVGMYIDDVPVNIPFGAQVDVRPFDLQRVEVLRGPQGTLFGEGAQAGAIRFFTNDPNLSEVEGTVEVGVHSYTGGDSSTDVRLAVSVPLIEDKLALRVVGNHTERGGYIDNVRDGDDNINSWEADNFRAVLLAEPTDKFRARLVYMHEELDQDAFGMVTNQDDYELDFFTSKDTIIKDEYDIGSLNLSYDFDSMQVISITSYQERTRKRDIIEPVFTAQIDAINLWVLQTAIGILPPETQDFSDRRALDETSFEQFSQEIRFVSNFDGPLNFVAGLFYRDYDAEIKTDFDTDILPLVGPIFASFSGVIFDQPAMPSTTASVYAQQVGLQGLLDDAGIANSGTLFGGTTNEAEQTSVFVEATYDVKDNLRLIAGIRYHDETLDGTGVGAITEIFDNTPPSVQFEASTEVEEWLPKLAIEYTPTDDTLVYAVYSAGVRNGNVNTAGQLATVAAIDGPEVAQDLAAYDPERVDAYEVGFKGSFLDQRLNMSAALFYNEISDIQTFGLKTIEETGFTVGLTVNPGDAESYGGEIEFDYAVTDYVSIYGGGNWVTAEYKNIKPVEGVSLDVQDGKQLPFIPEWGGMIGVNFVVPINNSWETFGDLNYSYVGEYSTFADGEVGSDFNPLLGEYGLTNLVLGVRNDNWTVNFRVSNVFDESELVSVSPITSLFGSFGVLSNLTEELDNGLTFDDLQVTPPRAYTLTVGYNF